MRGARILSKLPPERRKTYAIESPAATHWRDADCGEVDCTHHALGWKTTVDEATGLGRWQAGFIRTRAGRRFTESRSVDGALTVFVFPPGQRCFREHRVRLDREPAFVVRGGDRRGNPRGERRVHDRPEHWVEDFAGHQDRLRAAQG